MSIRITINGRLVRDPEFNETHAGDTVAKFSIASSRGKTSDATDFLDCESWASSIIEHLRELRKGQWLKASGSVVTDSYTAKDGSKRKSFVVRVKQLETPVATEEAPA